MSDRPLLRRIRADHPEWPVMLLAAAAWAFLALKAAAPAGHHGSAHDGGTDVLGLTAMVAAMMLPLTVAGVREAAFSGLRPRRAIAKFLMGYLGVWILAMLLIDVAWRRLGTGGTSAAVATMLVAALWEFPAKHPRLRGCGTGRRPRAGHALSGVLAGGGCVASCWALMAACVAFAHSFPVMVALFCVQLSGRYRPSASPTMTALAVLGACLASLALRTAGPHAV